MARAVVLGFCLAVAMTTSVVAGQRSPGKTPAMRSTKQKMLYLTDALTRLVNGHLASRLGELTPWAWQAANTQQ